MTSGGFHDLNVGVRGPHAAELQHGSLAQDWASGPPQQDQEEKMQQKSAGDHEEVQKALREGPQEEEAAVQEDLLRARLPGHLMKRPFRRRSFAASRPVRQRRGEVVGRAHVPPDLNFLKH